MPFWQSLTRDKIELEYNPRHAVPDFQKYFQWRDEASRSVRAMHGAPLTYAYGVDTKQAVDYFPLDRCAAVVCFLHGGAWRAGDRSNFHYMMPALRDLGLACALIGYPLAPDAAMSGMVDGTAAAFAILLELTDAPVVVVGHSAGAQLSTCLLRKPNFAARLSGACLISGLYDLAAVAQTSINRELKLTDEEIALYTPFADLQPWTVPTSVVVGGLETEGFRDESQRILELAPPGLRRLTVAPDENHFSIVRQFADPGSLLIGELKRLALDVR